MNFKELLKASDQTIKGTPPSQRPNVAAFDLRPEHPYEINYIKFLSGIIGWPPFAYDFEISSDTATEMRIRIRTAIAMIVGVEHFNKNGFHKRVGKFG